jgi:hypothetical protein
MTREIKKCGICGFEIDDRKQDYYLLQSYRQGTYLGKMFYHKSCFDGTIDSDKDLHEIKRKSKELLNKASMIMDHQMQGMT